METRLITMLRDMVMSLVSLVVWRKEGKMPLNRCDFWKEKTGFLIAGVLASLLKMHVEN